MKQLTCIFSKNQNRLQMTIRSLTDNWPVRDSGPYLSFIHAINSEEQYTTYLYALNALKLTQVVNLGNNLDFKILAEQTNEPKVIGKNDLVCEIYEKDVKIHYLFSFETKEEDEEATSTMSKKIFAQLIEVWWQGYSEWKNTGNLPKDVVINI